MPGPLASVDLDFAQEPEVREHLACTQHDRSQWIVRHRNR